MHYLFRQTLPRFPAMGAGTALRAALLLGLAGANSLSSAFAQTNRPNTNENPSTLKETYSDWTVSCHTQEPQLGAQVSVCQMSQELRDRVSGQLVLAFALPAKSTPDSTDAVIIAPFGLDLSKGIQLKVMKTAGASESEQADQIGPQVSAPFHTCLPQGCVAKFEFGDPMFRALRSGSEARLNMASMGQGKSVQVKISLKGFTAAERRLKALAARFD